jgi:glutathione peroxidase
MKILLFLLCLLPITGSVYELQFTDTDGNTVAMSQFEHKKILLVNIASGSNRASQLAGLQQLQQQYADSVVVIGFPSNSFGNEQRSNSQIKQFCHDTYGVTFLLAAKNDVTGESMQTLYNWLTKESENGVANQLVRGDFQKYLINSNGQLIGLFSSSVEPLSPEIVNAINE